MECITSSIKALNSSQVEPEISVSAKITNLPYNYIQNMEVTVLRNIEARSQAITARRLSESGSVKRKAVIRSAQFDSDTRKRRKGVHWPVSIMMQQAITDGDLEQIRELISEHGNKTLIESEPSGLFPAMRAVFESQLDSLKLLVEKGADLTAQDPQGWNVLHVAAAMDDLEAAEFVIASCNESLTSAYNADQERPIDLADSVEMARLLLQADMREPGRLERETLQEKSEEYATEMTLLRHVRNSHEKNGHCESFNKILHSTTDFDSLLHLAASKNYPRLANYLLKHRIVENDAIDERGWTALHMAAYFSSVDVLLILLQYGASVHILTNSYEKALDLSELELIQSILEEEEKVNVV